MSTLFAENSVISHFFNKINRRNNFKFKDQHTHITFSLHFVFKKAAGEKKQLEKQQLKYLKMPDEEIGKTASKKICLTSA